MTELTKSSTPLVPALSANEVVEASSHILKLRQLLAWDIACMRQHAGNSAFPVQLTMLDGKNTQVVLNTKDLEDLFGSMVAKELNWLEERNINVDEILTAYRTAAEKILGKGTDALQSGEQTPS